MSLHNVHDLVEANAYDSSQDVCTVRECELCLTSNLLLSDFDEEKKTISFMNWQWVDKNIAKINQTLPFDQAIEKASGILQLAEVGFEARMRYNLPILVSRTLAFYFLLLLPRQW